MTRLRRRRVTLTARLHTTAVGFAGLLLLLGSARIARAGLSVGTEQRGMEILNGSCASCHNLIGPALRTVQELRDRRGPDLFYAGNKYKAEWVERWLQSPSRIRPAGMFYGHHLKRGGNTGEDQVDETSLIGHPVISALEAKAVTATLMTLRAKSDLIRPGAYQPGTISKLIGEMLFVRFFGCLACHRIEPDYGGLSGPELYTAAERLQEDYLVSLLENPQAWDPKGLMPNRHLAEPNIQKLVHYLRGLNERWRKGQP